MITPPVGLKLFVASGVAGMPMMRVVRAALPFLGVLFLPDYSYLRALDIDVPAQPLHGSGDHHKIGTMLHHRTIVVRRQLKHFWVLQCNSARCKT